MHEHDAESPHLDWRQALRRRVDSTLDENEGLRERKKRLTRQLISDTATLLFLERGFDEVKITEVAAACGVSEKTIYNYFPTKESLVLDQEEDMREEIARGLGPSAGRTSPVDAITSIIAERLHQLVSYSRQAGFANMAMIRRFAEMIDTTPSLRNAQADMTERLAQVAARAMAARADVDPDDPEPQIAADALLGLWRVFFRATVKYADEGRSLEEFERAVLEDVHRAARLIDSGLWSFSVAVQKTNSRDQLKNAADASNEARKQVVIAIKQAKAAWHQIKSDVKHHAHTDHDDHRHTLEAQKATLRRTSEQLRRDSQNLRDVARQTKKDALSARQQLRQQRKGAGPRSTQ
ncbi:MAG: TetR/AcrR family transcriptional regulator [Acidimicrobiales bacterium]